MNIPVFFSDVRFKALLFGIVLAVLAGVMVARIETDIDLTTNEAIWFSLLVIVVIFPFLYAAITKKFDIFEPIYFISLISVMYFGLIPFLMAQQLNGFTFYGVNYRPYLATSVGIATIGLVGFYLGYFSGKKYIRMDTPSWITGMNPIMMRRFIFFGLMLVVVLVILWIQVGGFPIWSLNIFDERADYGTWYEMSGVNIGYLYSARLAFISILLLWMAYRKKKSELFWWFIVFGFVSTLYIILGTRSNPLSLFIATGVYIYLEKRRRPKLMLLILLFIIMIVFNGVIGIERSSRQELINPLQDIWSVFIEGNSIILGMSMIVLVFPNLIPYQKGTILFSELLLPVPRILWPGKPNNVLLEYIRDVVPIHYSPPVFGGWYADFGLLGPIIVLFLLGVFCAYSYKLWFRNQEIPGAKVLLALTIASLLIIYTRVNAVGFVWIFWVFTPVIIFHILSKKRDTGIS